MKKKHGFIRFSPEEFETWMALRKVGRTVLTVQLHHTFIPSYRNFDGRNHFELQRSMRNYHVHHNGWSDLGQHLTVFPDGSVLTGRSMERSPACIYGQNSSAFCVEIVGNFDRNEDEMSTEQREAILRITALLCRKFNLPLDTNHLVYHHWFDLKTGRRNNGGPGNKSCPGTAFFGGNSVEAARANLLPAVKERWEQISGPSLGSPLIRYAAVKARMLNVRTGPGYRQPRATDRDPLPGGSIVRVFEEAENGWVRISSKTAHWVSGRFLEKVQRMRLARDAKARTGPGRRFWSLFDYYFGEEVFVGAAATEGWHRIHLDQNWLHRDDLISL